MGEQEMKDITPFHLAFPVDDLAAARHFYGTVLGCPEGRSADTWIDFDLFGHQIVAHYKPHEAVTQESHHNKVDGHEELANRLKEAGVKFVIEPYIRFKGEVGEQATMFFLDPAGNALEFKAFADISQLFAK
jgi:extradiol dioxygenase family protein